MPGGFIDGPRGDIWNAGQGGHDFSASLAWLFQL
jgi:hypothetical protein